MHLLRRAVLRSALSAPKTAAQCSLRIAPRNTWATSNLNGAAVSSPMAARFISNTTGRSLKDDKELESKQRTAEENLDRQITEDAREDVEEQIAQSNADIQEAVQEVMRFADEEARDGTQTNQKSSFEEQVARSEAQLSNYEKPASYTAGAASTLQPAKSVFVRNLVFEITEEHLEKAFSKYGNVTHTFIARDPRGLSKGYGFVTFDSPEAVQAACLNVNGSFWHGRRITCIPRRNEEKEPQRNNKGPGYPTQQLFIGNIPYETTDAELNRIFRGLKGLDDVRVAVDRNTGWPRGFAHADFLTVEDAIEAKKKLETVMLSNRKLRVDYAHGFPRRMRRSSVSQST